MSSITALLGPTNTGKTFHAMERLLTHRTGMIGFPLRLLARENYDRLIAARGPEQVALVTGEERIVPRSPSYFVCTVEAMPLDRRVDFLAVDEVQLAADRERGHVFTDRLLKARGLQETMFLGADTIKPLLRTLVPEAAVVGRPRLSTLTYAPPRKLGRLPRRTAVVVFSVAEVYEVAERVRQEVGGAALVFGALSPRTRNAQVALYQAGEVDYLVATDAIGMGLNLDVDHVAFTSLVKFDGHGPRPLKPAEVAQIAGRAGRYLRDGTFGPTTDLGPFDQALVQAVEQHRFEPLDTLYWRNSELSFASAAALLASLEARPPLPQLIRMREAGDHMALAALVADPDVRRLAAAPDAVRLLWDVAQVPDFRNVMTEAHTRLLAQMFLHLQGPARRLPEDWVAAHVGGLDRTDGDVDQLLARIAHIRTWTYVSHRPAWVFDARFWQERTRAVEDRLSDALHERLTEQFVDRRAAVVARYGADEVAVEVTEGAEVLVQGMLAGRMEGFRFLPDPELRDSGKGVKAAANRALRADIGERVRAFMEEEDVAFALSAAGHVLWRGIAVARLVPGDDVLSPRVEPLASDLLEPPHKERVRRRLADWLQAHLGAALGPLLRLSAEAPPGPARGVVFAVGEGLGSTARRSVAGQLRALGPEDRRELSRLRLTLGRLSLYVAALLKPDVLRLRGILWAVRHGGEPFPLLAGAPSVAADPRVPAAYYMACGHAVAGPRAVRVDRLERLATAAHRLSRQGAFAVGPELASVVGATPAETAAVLTSIGYVADKGGTLRWRGARPRAG